MQKLPVFGELFVSELKLFSGFGAILLQQLVHRHRLGVIIPLKTADAVSAQKIAHLSRFNTFHTDLCAERLRQIGDKLHRPLIGNALLDIFHIFAVDLECIDRNITQQTDRRISRAEVIKRDLDAVCLQFAEHIFQHIDIEHPAALRDLQTKILRREIQLVQQRNDLRSERAHFHLRVGNIDIDNQIR